MVTWTQHSFVGGFLNKTLMGRQDLARYYDGASELENMRIAKQGYISKRRGTSLTSDLAGLFADGSEIVKVRLLPFSATLEAGYYILFAVSSSGLKRAFVLNETGILTTANTYVSSLAGVTAKAIAGCEYAAAELDELGWTQSGDTLFVAHKNHTVAKIYRTNDTTFVYEPIDFSTLGETSLPTSPKITKVTGEGFVKDGDENASDYPAKRSVRYKVTAVVDGVESAPSASFLFTYRLPWPDKAKALIEWSAVADAEYYNIYKKEGVSYALIGSTKDDDSVVSQLTTNSSKPSAIQQWVGNGAENNRSYSVNKKKATLVSATASGLESTGSYTIDYTVASYFKDTDGAWKLSHFPGYKRISGYNNTWPSGASVTVKWKGVSGVNRYIVYRRISHQGAWGIVGIAAHSAKGNEYTCVDYNKNNSGAGTTPYSDCTVAVNSASNPMFEDDYIQGEVDTTPPVYKNHFHETGKYPSCVAMYLQRLALASTKDEPFTLYLSCTGDLYNFNEHGSLREDDTIEATLPATEFPAINHMVLSRDLILFCENGMWIVSPCAGTTLSYKTIQCHKSNSIGTSKSVPPLYCGDYVVSVDVDRRTVRGGRYSYASDGLEMQELSVYASDLFKNNPIVRMAWQQNPDMTLWFVLANGTLASMTFMPEQEVISWGHHTFGGGVRVIDVAANKSQTNGCDNVSFVVETRDGGWEVWHIRSDNDDYALEEQLCLDGMKILAGGDIAAAVFADEALAVIDLTTGAPITSAGALNPNREYALGYPFAAKLTTIPPQIQGEATMQLRIKNLKKADFRLVDASDFFVVPKCLESRREYWARVAVPSAVADGTLAPYTGDATMVPSGANHHDGRVCVIHEGPLPFTLTYLSLDYAYDPNRGGQG